MSRPKSFEWAPLLLPDDTLEVANELVELRRYLHSMLLSGGTLSGALRGSISLCSRYAGRCKVHHPLAYALWSS